MDITAHENKNGITCGYALCAAQYARLQYNETFLRLVFSLKIRRSAFVGHAHRCGDYSLFIRLFVYSRVKGWLNRSVRATRERLYSGHCFHTAGEKNLAVRWSRDLQPVAIQLELFRESRKFHLEFSKRRQPPARRIGN